ICCGDAFRVWKFDLRQFSGLGPLVNSLDSLPSGVLLLSVASARVAAAFVILPVFSPQTVPPLIRNAIFVSMAVLVFLVQPGLQNIELTGPAWAGLFAKEIMIGIVIGFLFALILYASEIAGQIIDGQIGMTIAQIVDPLTGHQTSLTGSFLGRLANYVFMASGGFLFFTGALLQSYIAFPINGSLVPDLSAGSMHIENAFADVMAQSLLFAAPALVIMLGLDLALGLVNRYAPQLNVFSLSLSIKAWLATAMVLLIMTTLVGILIDSLSRRSQDIIAVLDAMF
ncbi:MAG: type III secretion system export apparatus subunit SctT, partial [Pseudomonadota bacterium]